ncbi:MAG TPA: hypothetical protein VJT71_13130 [Pyrinomonadaceae bacterium]|nr:hypothetical protein [Pyrinomonadaceae bacterium]
MVKRFLFQLICCLVICFLVLVPVNSQTEIRRPLPAGIKLVLETTIVSKQYCSTAPFLLLTLSLKFTNLGDKPILLDRRSKLIGRELVSRNLKDLAGKKYLYKVSPMLDLAGAGIGRNLPEDLMLFAVLKPGESLTTSTESRVDVIVGPDRDGLPPGKYLLQVRVITWYYYPSATDRLRAQWQDRGYLWTTDLTSKPMTFEVESKPALQPCSIH